MSMIRGKFEASREVSPQFVTIGSSDFVRTGETWKSQSEPQAKIVIVDLNEELGLAKNSENEEEDIEGKIK